MKDFQGYGTYQNRVRCSGPGGGNVLAVQQDRFDLRHILGPRHAMEKCVFEIRPFSKLDGLEQCAAQALNHCPEHLVAQPVGIHNRAALKDFEKFCTVMILFFQSTNSSTNVTT